MLVHFCILIMLAICIFSSSVFIQIVIISLVCKERHYFSGLCGFLCVFCCRPKMPSSKSSAKHFIQFLSVMTMSAISWKVARGYQNCMSIFERLVSVHFNINLYTCLFLSLARHFQPLSCPVFMSSAMFFKKVNP